MVKLSAIEVMDRKLLKKIIADGVRAPSGDNLQQWRFEVHGDTLDIYSIEIFNLHDTNSYATYISHGALVENIVISAKYHGYETQVIFFPESMNCSHTARIVFMAGEKSDKDGLYAQIKKRATTRNQSIRHTLFASEVDAIAGVDITDIPDFRAVYISDRARTRALARPIATQIELLFGNKTLHRVFMDNIRFSHTQIRETQDGIPLESLGLQFHKKIMMKYILRRTSLVPLFKALLFHKFMSLMEISSYKSSAGYIAIIAKRDCPVTPLYAGRIFERIWLTATRVGLSLQPTLAVFLLRKSLSHPDAHVWFSENEQKKICSAASQIESIVGLHSGEHIVAMFRVAIPKHPSVPTPRKSPSIIFHT